MNSKCRVREKNNSVGYYYTGKTAVGVLMKKWVPTLKQARWMSRYPLSLGTSPEC